MSKNLAQNNQAQSSISPSPLASLYVGDTPKSGTDGIDAVLRETDPQNVGYRVGAMLRKAYDYISSKISFGLPMAEAVPISKTPANKKFLQLLETTEFNYHSDTPPKRAEAVKRQKLVIKNIKESFKTLANEGELTRRMLEEALNGNVRFTVVDNRYSEQEVTKWEKILGGPLGGLYKSQTNELLIFAAYDGKNSEGTIKHELIHYLETIFGKDYDADTITQCKKDLDSKLGLGAVLCLDQPTKKECEEIRKQAAKYRGRTAKKLSSKVNYEADRGNPNSGIVGILTLGDNFPKLKTNAAVVRVIKDGDFCTLQLESIQDMNTNKVRRAKPEEKDLFNMAMHIAEAPSRAVIERNYLRAPQKIKDSEHYAEISTQPEGVLEEVCKGIMPISHKRLLKETEREL